MIDVFVLGVGGEVLIYLCIYKEWGLIVLRGLVLICRVVREVVWCGMNFEVVVVISCGVVFNSFVISLLLVWL